MAPKAQTIEEKKIDKLYFMKIKTFFLQKILNKKMKQEDRDWEKIFAKYVSHKGLVSTICKELLEFNRKQTKT